MSFVRLTRPDGSPLAINAVIHAAPVPARGALLATGTPIVFRNHSHQDVPELLDEAISRIGAARSARAVFAAPAPVTCGTSRKSRS